MHWFRRPEHHKDNAARPAARRNLLVVRAGDGSLHPGWIAGAGTRDFDLLVSYFGRQPGRYRNEAEHYHEMQGPRWPAHNVICREHPGILAPYDQVCFACDDLVADLDTWNRLFATCRLYALDLAQPAIEGHVSYEITRPVDGCVLRYTNFVEIMCPVFSSRALTVLRDTFGESVSGWGLNWVWPKLLAGDAWRIGIVDSARVRHSRPLREGPLYPLLHNLGVNPIAELEALQARFEVLDKTPRELGRLVLKETPS
jgi:hypothetical protein